MCMYFKHRTIPASNDCMIMGFNLAFDMYQIGRIRLNDLLIYCVNGMQLVLSGDKVG